MRIQATDALLVIDLQRDFMPAIDGVGGALAVAGGDDIVAGINGIAAIFEHVIVTQDWHPAGHISFASAHPGASAFTSVEAEYGPQALWPDHCVQHSVGAELHPALDIPHTELILRKGFRREIDSYSAFLENDHRTPTGLRGYLRERGLTRLFLCGLAYDFCVRYSAIDGKELGFETIVLQDLTRAVGLPSLDGRLGSVEATDATLAASKIERITSAKILR